MRLIDADLLIEKAKQDGAYDYVSAEEIANAPTIDAVPVVRCKDCVYCEPYAIDTGEDCMTGLWCGENQKDMTLQDFCSYGERKGGDTE